VVVCLDADPLGSHPAAVAHAAGWAERRKQADQGKMNRVYVAEPTMTVTGTNADVRRSVRRGAVAALADALEATVNGQAAAKPPVGVADFVAAAAEDLKKHQGKGMVVVGPGQPASVHAAAHRINAKLGNTGKTVRLIPEDMGNANQTANIQALVTAIGSKAVTRLLILGGNPVYNAPADSGFAQALATVRSAHLSLYHDETSKACQWHLPAAHYLECWSDARTWDGTLGVQQPLIQPLFAGRSAAEAVMLIARKGGEAGSGYGLVRETFKAFLPADRFERTWRRVLHDGLLKDSAPAPVATAVKEASAGVPASGAGLELVFIPDRCLHDGRFANNGWLQELPDPITKITWDNAVQVSPATAAELGVRLGDVVTLTAGGHSVSGPVQIQPGQATGSVVVSLGYGRTAAGPIGDAVGFDAYQVRTAMAMHATPVAVAKAGRTHKLIATQDHHLIDPKGAEDKLGREEREDRATHALVREATLEQYDADPHFAQAFDRKLLDAHGLINEKGLPLIAPGAPKRQMKAVLPGRCLRVDADVDQLFSRAEKRKGIAHAGRLRPMRAEGEYKAF